MKIFVICSKRFYKDIPPIKRDLEKMGMEVFLPNCYDKPETEAEMWNLSPESHQKFKAEMYKRSEELIRQMDAVLVLNYDREDKNIKNYIGGATFLEIYDAFRFGKKIYLYNDIPEGILYDEIQGFGPIVINKDLSLIK